MPRTALELTAEALRSYHPERLPPRPPAIERWTQAWDVARVAAQILREQFAAERVVAFGSLARRERFTVRSDVDLAAWGIEADQFYRAVAAISGFSPDFEVQLVDIEDCPPSLQQRIQREGIDIP